MNDCAVFSEDLRAKGGVDDFAGIGVGETRARGNIHDCACIVSESRAGGGIKDCVYIVCKSRARDGVNDCAVFSEDLRARGGVDEFVRIVSKS